VQQRRNVRRVRARPCVGADDGAPFRPKPPIDVTGWPPGVSATVFRPNQSAAGPDNSPNSQSAKAGMKTKPIFFGSDKLSSCSLVGPSIWVAAGGLPRCRLEHFAARRNHLAPHKCG